MADKLVADKLDKTALDASHPAVSSFIIGLVMPVIVGVLQTILADPNKKKTFRKTLIAARNILTGANLGD